MRKTILYLITSCTVMCANFNTSVNITLRHEGSKLFKSKHGEVSKFGITKEVLKSWNKNVKIENLSKQQAIEIYKARYWKISQLSKLESQALANHIFDFSVNSGTYRASLELQKMCNRFIHLYNMQNSAKLMLLDEDGICGTKTIEIVNLLSNFFTSNILVQEYKVSRLTFLKRLGDKWDSYGKGWTYRIENI